MVFFRVPVWTNQQLSALVATVHLEIKSPEPNKVLVYYADINTNSMVSTKKSRYSTQTVAKKKICNEIVLKQAEEIKQLKKEATELERTIVRQLHATVRSTCIKRCIFQSTHHPAQSQKEKRETREAAGFTSTCSEECWASAQRRWNKKG